MGKKLIQRIFEKRERVTVANACIPENTRVYVVGDIHGRADLLRRMHQLILNDAAKVTPDVNKVVVYLGDYVDRGMHSKDVIDFLLNNQLNGFKPVYLKGNHEEQFLEFLDDASAGEGWLEIGGNATVHSYGVRIQKSMSPGFLEHLQSELLNALPKSHLDFLSRLELTLEMGNYLLVHAGINPYEPLKRQTPEDLLWIRSEFLESESNYGVVIVHGHSVTDAPEVRDNRIGIDTGAYASNNLTCLVLEGSTKRFLSTDTKEQPTGFGR